MVLKWMNFSSKNEEGGRNMFIGNYNHSVDEKGRFIMPAKYREQLDGRCVVTKGIDGNGLYIYDMKEWENFIGRLRQLPNSRPEIRDLQRHFVTEAETVEIDKQGRCLISANLRQYAGITSEIRLMGVDNKIELWSMESWNKYNMEKQPDVAEIAATVDLII